jgi:hypothetical protein
MKLLYFTLIFVLTVGASTSQELIVSDYGYYMDGTEAQKLVAFDSHFDPHKSVIVQACADADISRLNAALDWLSEKGKVNIMVRTVTEEDQQCCVKASEGEQIHMDCSRN